MNSHKPSNGIRSVLPGETNDPVVYCDPQGIPREDLYELRTTQIFQTPLKVIVLYEFGKLWRVIWTDGRDLPKDPEPRWYGYSVGKWEDDYTFVVQTTGTDERTWIDRAGRPHSGDLRVEEKFHRVDQDTLELTVTINDPKMYTKPWVALDKLRFKLKPPNFDVREMMCSPQNSRNTTKSSANPPARKAPNSARVPTETKMWKVQLRAARPWGRPLPLLPSRNESGLFNAIKRDPEKRVRPAGTQAAPRSL